MATRQEQADATKAAIVDAGLTLLSEKDAAHVSVAEIMRECGLSPGLFYHYYESKDQFIASLVMRNWNQSREILEDPNIPAVKRLREYIMVPLHGFAKISPQLRRNLNAYRMTDAYIQGRERLLADDAMYNWMRECLEDGISKGIFSSELPVEFVVKLIVYVVHGIDFNAALYKREWHDFDWCDQFFDFVEEELLKPYLLQE